MIEIATMDDINAKRNARRRRILENLEKRLSTITGRNSNCESGVQSIHHGLCNETFIATNPQKETIHSNENGKTLGVDSMPNQLEHFLPVLLTNRINYIVLAAIVNVLLILQLDHLFWKIIILPYFPMMLGRTWDNYKRRRNMQENNLLYAALILCNLKPALAYQLKELLSLIHMILEDLALYIFSFTLIHYGLLYCLHGTNITLNS